MTKFYTLLTISLTLLAVTSTQAQDSDNCELVYHWSNDELPASFAHNNTYNEIWGVVANGRDYAIIGSTMGTHIFDITDEGSESEIHFIEGAVTGGNIVHRDYHDYDGYLYIVCDEGPSTLQIVDISGLPDVIDVVYDSGALFQRSHNIFIDADAKMMYVCGGNNQLNLYSLSDPVDPQLVVNCSASVPNWSGTVGYVHDIYVEDGIAYCNAGGNGLFIVDFTDPTNPQIIGDLTDYEDSGYNHSGWLHPDGQYYALADETHGMRIKLLDVSDPTDIQVVSLFGVDIAPQSIPHNLIFEGDYLHVSYYFDGYYVFDISDPLNVEIVAFYDTSTVPHSNGYKGAWGVYPFMSNGKVLVSDMQEGLFVLQPDIASGVSESRNTAVSVYPNPIQGNQLTVLNLPESTEVVSVFNAQGRLINAERNTNSGALILTFPSSLAQGYYLLTIQTDRGFSTVPFVK